MHQKMISLKKIRYKIANSFFGEIGIIWRRIDRRERIIHIILPHRLSMERIIKHTYPDALSDCTGTIEEVCKKIEQYTKGVPINFVPDMLDMSRFHRFQKKVILTERKIPYGRVSTYGRLAEKIGRPSAARAVGTALARNPFPIIIPCHRTIRADGTLGGYQGGTRLKRALLELEGVQFNRSGTVVLEKVW